MIDDAIVKLWIEQEWGDRCPDYESGCSVCAAWKCFDFLTNPEKHDNPFKKENDMTLYPSKEVEYDRR